MERRTFMQTTSAMAAAGVASQAVSAFAAESSFFKIGMCDWNVKNAQNRGGSCRPDFIPFAVEAGLQGVQVSVATAPDNVALRDPKVRQQYKDLCQKYDFHIHSVAAGSILNSIPLASEPESAVYVIEAVEAAHALGAKNILTAFFGRGDLRYKDNRGRDIQLKENPNEFMLDQRGVDRVVNALRQIAPRAEDLGVALGLENTINAKQNLEIIERVGSDIVQVYYDVGNSTGNGYDVPAELRMLGNGRICEIHLKDWKTSMLGSPEGMVDFKACAQACRDIGYDKWFVLETSGRKDRFVEDTKANVAFVKKMFA